jgi:DNA-directed RNA polymerase subunit M
MERKLTHIPGNPVFVGYMKFCDACGSLMHTEDETWVCRSCENEEPRDSNAEAAMATRDGQQDDGAPDVADATQDSAETVNKPCPTDDCDSDQAYSEMMPKPGGSYEVRLFTCVDCGHKWRGS